MRLTLRTLLSWKDGMLDAASGRELAAKVAATPAAGQLEERIRDVVSRQTLPAPPVGAAGEDDPNATAEYLDNVMQAERIAEFERRCFASDVQLAETAACHEILAELLRSPAADANVDAATCGRLLAAAQAAAARAVPRTDADAARIQAAANAPPVPAGGIPPGGVPVSVFDPAGVPGGGPRPATAGVRRAEKRAPASAWLLLALATLLLAVLVGVFGWSVRRGGVRRVAVAPPAAVSQPAGDQPVVREVEAEPPVADVAKPAAVMATAPPVAPPAAPPAPAAESPAGPDRPVAAASTPHPPAEAAPPPPPPTAVPADVPAPPSPAAPSEPRVPQGDALAIVAPASPVSAPTVPPAAAPAPPPAPSAAGPAAAEAMSSGDLTVEGEAVILVRSGGVEPQPWRALSRGAAVDLPLDLLAPAFSQPVVVVDGVRITLLPGTRAVLARDAAAVPRIELLFGAVVLTSPDADGRVGVAAGSLVGTITDGLAMPIGVEAELVRDPGADPAATQTRSRIIAAAGPLTFIQANDEGRPPLAGIAGTELVAADRLQPPARGAALAWTSRDPAAAAIMPLATVPAWLAGRASADPLDRAAGLALAARLRRDGDPLAALGDLATDRRSENRIAAAATLALLGDYGPLVEQLCAEDPRRALRADQWRKLEALAVPLAFARGANAAAKLGQAFVDRGPPGSGAVLAEFARGHDAAAFEAGAAATLVAALDSPHLAVRRYAIKNLVEIAAPDAVDAIRYRPDGLPEQRREAADWWRQQLDQGRIRRAAPASPPPRAGPPD